MPNSGVDMNAPNWGAGIPDTSGNSFEIDTATDRARALQQHNSNVTMSLLAAGLAALASRAKRPGQALGQAGLVGLGNYQIGESNIARQQETDAQNRALNAYRGTELSVKEQEAQGLQNYRQGALGEQRHRTDVMQADAQMRAQQAEQNAKATQDARAVQEQIAAANLQLNAARTDSQRQVALSTIAKNQQALSDAQPLGYDPFAQYRNAKWAANLPDPSIAASVPRGKAPDYVNRTLAVVSKPGFGDKPMSTKDMLAVLQKPPKDYAFSRIDPDDNVVFENASLLNQGAGAIGGNIWGPIKIKVPGAYETLGPNGTPPPPPPDKSKTQTPPPNVKPLGAVDPSKYKEGQRYKMPDGSRVVIRGGAAYPITGDTP